MAQSVPQPGLANDVIQLATLSKSGVPPKTRLGDAGRCQDLVQELIDADKDRSLKTASLVGMFNGNSPFNAAQLRAASQSWRANFSSLEGKAYLSNAMVPYYDLFGSTKHRIDFNTGYGSSNQREEWSGIISEEMDVTVKQWKGFNVNVWTMIWDFVGFGQGFLFFQNRWDWRFKRIDHRKVLVLDGTDADLEVQELIVVRQEYQVCELYRKIRNENISRASGWRPDAVKEAIRNAVPHNPDDTLVDWPRIQQELNDHDLLTSTRASTIKVGRVYAKEFDGTITEVIVTEEGDPQFLYKKERRYSSMSEVLGPFFLEVMSGSWHGATGLAKDIYNMILAKDRLNCAEMDAAFLRAGITLVAKSASAMNKIGLVQFGGAFNIIPPDFDIQQSSVLGDIQTIIAVGEDLDRRLSRNTGIYRASPEKPQGNPETATAASMRFQMSTVLGDGAVDRFYDQLDPFYDEVARRMCEPNLTRTDPSSIAALDFQERCKRRGVPKAALLSRRSVTAFRAMGNGSPINRQSTLQAITPFYQFLPESGRSNFLDDVISTHTNRSMVDRYNPRAERMGQPTDQHALAMLENAAMKTGAQVVWTPTQNNLIHAEVHLKSNTDGAKSLTQGANPMEVLAFMEISGPHIAKHLQELAQDPSHKPQYESLNAEFERLGRIADKLHDQVQQMQQHQQEEAQKQQQAQAISSGMDGDTAIKAAVANAKVQQSEIKTQAGLRHKEEKHQQDMAQKQQDMQIKDAQAAAQIAIDKAKADAKVGTQ